jgi:transcriptional regulator with XRE-family HTH domain
MKESVHEAFVAKRKGAYMKQESLAEKLRLLRAERGLTLVQASELTGVTRGTLSELESGKRVAYMPTLSKIAEGYGVDVRELLLEEPVGSPKGSAPSAGRPSVTPRIASVGPTGRGPNVSHEMLAELGIEATDAELNSLNIYIENRWRNRVEGAPSAIVSLARDEVDHEKIARWSEAVEDALHYWIAEGRFGIVASLEDEVVPPEKVKALRRHTREKLTG